MNKKKLKKNGQVKRLVNLEVDEVSLVDKPAIGEEIYVTKSQGGTEVAKKKLLKVKKAEGEEENKPGEAADPAAAASAAAPASADPASEEGEEEEEGAAAAEGEEEGEEEEGSEEGEDEGEEEEEDSEAEGDVAKRLVTVEKNLADVQEMLATSLDFHEQAAESLNQVVQITMMALDMLMAMDAESMPEAEEAGEATEMSATAKGVTEIRGLIKNFQKDVQKAGAKISSSRLSVLRDIATKLTELLSSVEADGKKAGKKTKKATSADIDSLKQQVADLKKSLLDMDSEKTELKKTVEEQANRLNGIEASAGGASAGIGDDDEEDEESETESGTQTKSKSVFAGLIPIDQIKESNRKKSEFLARKKEKETTQS